MVFLWSLQEAFNKKLGGYIVKGEDSGSISSLMKHFTVGSLAAADLASISDLFNQYEQNLSELPEVRVVDLTVDNDAQMEQELHDMKQEALEKSEALKNSLAKIVLNEEERKNYEEEVLLERNKLAQELSEASRVNKELKQENENLINLQSACHEK